MSELEYGTAEIFVDARTLKARVEDLEERAKSLEGQLDRAIDLIGKVQKVLSTHSDVLEFLLDGKEENGDQ